MLHIHSFEIQNLNSYKDRTEVSFVINKSEHRDNKTFKAPSGTYLNKLICIVGANASGKTHLLEALDFIVTFIPVSFRDDPDSKINIAPHFLSKNEPSFFRLIFEIESVIYKYELEATTERILQERLLAKQGNVWKKIFSKKLDKDKKDYKHDVTKFGVEQGFTFDTPQANKNKRYNASLISIARQFEVPLAKTITDNMGCILRNDVYLGPTQFFQAAKYFNNHDDEHEQTKNILQKFDPSLSSVEIKEDTMQNHISGKEEKYYFPYGIHRIGDKTKMLNFLQEASGIRASYALMPIMTNALQTGSAAIVDDFEAYLHPLMLEELLGLFVSPKLNPKNAQILFTTHAPNILNTLEKNQIMITEKYDNHYLFSEAYRLDEIQGVERRGNFFAKYMAGAYGGIPEY